MKLGIDFIIFSLIVLSLLIPLYLYRKQLFKFIYKASDFDTFLTEVKKHLIIEHPNIKMNFSIVEQTKNEENPKTRQILVVENLITQFCEFEIFISTQPPIDKEHLWQTYENDSFPQKEKLPKDWLRRKDTAWKRDNCQCKRCGMKIQMNDAQIYLLKDIKEGGTYHFENLLTVCNDCNKILNSTDLGKTAKSLDISEALMNKVI